MNQLSTTTQQNAAASEELAATSEEMSGQAEKLQQLMAFFSLYDAPSSLQPSNLLSSKQMVSASRTVARLGKSTEEVLNEKDFIEF